MRSLKDPVGAEVQDYMNMSIRLLGTQGLGNTAHSNTNPQAQVPWEQLILHKHVLICGDEMGPDMLFGYCEQGEG